MYNFAGRGFARGFLTRSAAAGQVAAAPVKAVAEPAPTAALPIVTEKAGETNLLTDNLWFVNSVGSEGHVFGFRWVPGLWARAKVESSETNVALFHRIKAMDITPRDIWNLSGLGLQMYAAFLVGSVIGKWKIFGYRGVEPHHGHGFWTDDAHH